MPELRPGYNGLRFLREPLFIEARSMSGSSSSAQGCGSSGNRSSLRPPRRRRRGVGLRRCGSSGNRSSLRQGHWPGLAASAGCGSSGNRSSLRRALDQRRWRPQGCGSSGNRSSLRHVQVSRAGLLNKLRFLREPLFIEASTAWSPATRSPVAVPPGTALH